MKDSFAQSSARNPAEEILQGLGCAFERQPDGTLVVAGDIDLTGRKLTRLPDLSSVIVKGNFYCYGNELTSLEGAPQTVGGSFCCNNNQLTSLKYAPQSVGGEFACHNNQLTSLEGAPQSVGGDFFCYNNQLTSLEYAPQTFKRLKSDLGEFTSWNDVPEQLRLSPRTKTRLEEERIRIEGQLVDSVRQATALRRPVAAMRTDPVRGRLKLA